MKKRRWWDISSAAVWAVVSLSFAGILVTHERQVGSSYSHINVVSRNGSEPSSALVNPNAANQTIMSIGPNGQSAVQQFRSGKDVDQPIISFSTGFNKYIDQLNSDKASDLKTNIILDLIGLVTSLFSCGYSIVASIRSDAP